MFDQTYAAMYDGQFNHSIIKMRERVQALLNIKKDDPTKTLFKLSLEQYNELDTMDIRLSRYNNGVLRLQEIVKNVNNDSEIKGLRHSANPDDKDLCKEKIERYINPVCESDAHVIYIRYFEMIPYLQKLLNDYWEELQRNPFTTPTETEKLINKMQAR